MTVRDGERQGENAGLSNPASRNPCSPLYKRHVTPHDELLARADGFYDATVTCGPIAWLSRAIGSTHRIQNCARHHAGASETSLDGDRLALARDVNGNYEVSELVNACRAHLQP